MGPVVDSVVPPTCVMYGLSSGKSINPLYASLSPEAVKNVCPWAAICSQIWSAIGSAPPLGLYQEQLICFARLSLAIRLSKSCQFPDGPASYMIIWDRPGAIDTAISISSDTSNTAGKLAGTPLNPSINTLVNGTFGRPARFS